MPSGQHARTSHKKHPVASLKERGLQVDRQVNTVPLVPPDWAKSGLTFFHPAPVLPSPRGSVPDLHGFAILQYEQDRQDKSVPSGNRMIP